MEKEIFFHTGLHKTATTFIQKMLFPNIEGLNYVKNETVFKELIDITQQDILTYNEKKIYEGIKDKLTSGKNIISAEALSGNPFMQYLNRYDILLKIKKTFPEAKIIVGIRNQKSMLFSIYKQYIRMGGTKRSEDFYRIDDNSKLYKSDAIYIWGASYMNPIALMYSKYLKSIIELFGAGNTLIYCFEELAEDYVKFANRFCSFFELDTPSIQNKIVNKAFPDSLYSVLRPLNHFFVSPFYERGFVKTPSSLLNVVGNILPKNKTADSGCLKAYEKFRNIYLDDNIETKKLIDISLHGYLDKYYV
jgi:hypothetical protein